MKNIAMIAAVAENLAIGNGNKLIYWLPDDLKRFKQLTTGHTIIMGSNTFRSLPKGALPNRRNIVLSRKGADCPGAEVVPSFEEAIGSCSAEEQIYIGETNINQKEKNIGDPSDLIQFTVSHAVRFFRAHGEKNARNDCRDCRNGCI